MLGLIALISFLIILFLSIFFIFEGTSFAFQSLDIYLVLTVVYIILLAMLYFLLVRKIRTQRIQLLKHMKEHPEEYMDKFPDIDRDILARYGTVALLMFNTRPSTPEIIYHVLTPDFKDNLLLLISFVSAYYMYPPLFGVPRHGYGLMIFASINLLMLEFSRWGYTSVQHMLKEAHKKIEELSEKQKPSKLKIRINRISKSLINKPIFDEKIDPFEIRNPFVFNIRIFPLIIASILFYWSFRVGNILFYNYS